MISFLPEIYPDELVYSWFCRYYVHSGCFAHKMALDDILYSRHNNPSKEFIGHLSSDAKEKIQSIARCVSSDYGFRKKNNLT